MGDIEFDRDAFERMRTVLHAKILRVEDRDTPLESRKRFNLDGYEGTWNNYPAGTLHTLLEFVESIVPYTEYRNDLTVLLFDVKMVEELWAQEGTWVRIEATRNAVINY